MLAVLCLCSPRTLRHSFTMSAAVAPAVPAPVPADAAVAPASPSAPVSASASSPSPLRVLTAEQLDFFHREGYLVVPDVLSADVLKNLLVSQERGSWAREGLVTGAARDETQAETRERASTQTRWNERWDEKQSSEVLLVLSASRLVSLYLRFVSIRPNTPPFSTTSCPSCSPKESSRTPTPTYLLLLVSSL